MIKKKAASKATGAERGKRSRKKGAKRRLKKEINPADVHKQVSQIVKSEAVEMTKAVVEEAMKGQVAPIRYLFEMANIFPAQVNPEQATEEEDCLAKILLSRIEAPPKPDAEDEDEVERSEGDKNPATTMPVASDGTASAKRETEHAPVGLPTSVT